MSDTMKVRIRTPQRGLFLSLLTPMVLFIGLILLMYYLGNAKYGKGPQAALAAFLFQIPIVVPTILLLHKFWSLNRHLSIDLIWPQSLIEVAQNGNTILTEGFSDIGRVVLITTYAWKRKFWHGDGILFWEPMHFATIFFKDGRKLTVTTLIVPDIPEMLRQMGAASVEHVVKYFPYPTKTFI